MINNCDNLDVLNDFKSFLTFFANGLEYEENKRHFVCQNLQQILKMNTKTISDIQNLSKLSWLDNT